MKILHYVSSFSKLSHTFIYDLILELERQGIDNYVVTKERLHASNRPFQKVEIIGKPKKWEPQHIIRASIEEIKHGHHLASRWPMIRNRLTKKVKQIQPDLIHSHFGPPGVEMSLVAKKFNLPHLVSFHGKDAFKNTRNPFWMKHYQNFKAASNSITCVSQYMADYLSDLFPNKNINVIHVGKKLEDYPFCVPSQSIKNWLSIGRLTEKKGHEYTIKAFSEILKKNAEQKLTIIGEGEDREKLELLIKDLALSKNVILLGAISHQRTTEELAKADAFVLASKTAKDGDKEGIPTVLMEAQAMGKPCVSTRHSGIPEVFSSSSQSLLAEEGNLVELTNKMEHLLSLPLKELKLISVEGRKKIEKEFNIAIEVQKLIHIYKSQTM